MRSRALRDLGYQLEPEQIDRVFEELKKLADKKKEIYDGDLDALLVGLFQNGTARRWQLASLNAVSGTGTPPTAAVSLLARDGRKLDEAATGDGPSTRCSSASSGSPASRRACATSTSPA